MQASLASDRVSSLLVHHAGPGVEEVEASLVMQAAVSAAVTEEARVLVVMAAPWSSLPPPWHLMSPVTPDIMKTISFIYPKGVKVKHSELYKVNSTGIFRILLSI